MSSNNNHWLGTASNGKQILIYKAPDLTPTNKFDWVCVPREQVKAEYFSIEPHQPISTF